MEWLVVRVLLFKASFIRREHGELRKARTPHCSSKREYLDYSKISRRFQLVLQGQTEFSITIHFLIQYFNSKSHCRLCCFREKL